MFALPPLILAGVLYDSGVSSRADTPTMTPDRNVNPAMQLTPFLTASTFDHD